MSSEITRSVYLDHAATTPMRPEAIAAMTEELARLGNPSSLHAAGRRARRVVEESREQLAEVFGARPSEVVFTSGGTEADNLAVKGLYWARRDGARRQVLTTSVEHHAVLDSVRWLADTQGAEAVWLGVDVTGAVHPDALRAAIARAPGQVAMVSVMWANNEVGTVQPVAELAAVAHEYGIPFHTDAVQAAAQLPVSFAASGADALSVSAHKLGGPLGVGALILARGTDPVPVLHGGGQERDVRSGTLDAPAIRAFAVAAQAAARHRAEEAARLAALRDDLVQQVRAAVPDAILNGPALGAVLNGSPSSAVLDGSASSAVLDGSASSAVLDGSASSAVLNGSAPDAVLHGSAPDAVLHGSASSAVLNGSAPDAVLHGFASSVVPSAFAHSPARLPGNAHFSFPGCEGDALLMLLDANGIACSTGSACTAGVAEPSHVLLAMGADESRARGSLRFSLGHTSTQADVDALAAVIAEVTDRARRAGTR